MAQRNQYRSRNHSIESTIRESSPHPAHSLSPDDLDDGGSDGRPMLHDTERSASPSTSTWSSENAETSQSNPAQSASYAASQRQDSTGIAASESDSISREQGTPRSHSNRSSHVRWSYQPMPSLSSLEMGRPLPEHHPLQEDFEALTDRQDAIPSHRRDDRPRIPTADELHRLPIVAHIIPPGPREGLENIIIVLHDHSGNENLLREFAELYLRPKDTACLLLRGVSMVAGKVDCYQWEDNLDTFLRASRLILDNVISALLISKCNFPARKIILFGQGEGAMAALSMCSAWGRVEFGGIICVGGQLPSYIALSAEIKSKTAVLLLGGALGMTTPVAKHRIEQSFLYVDCDLIEGKDDALPRGKQAKLLKDFFSHRLHEEEWTKPAVITFDGGGIRGYGSLLILQALMEKIGKEERRLDKNVESSFHPCMYKPRSKEAEPQPGHAGSGSGEALDPEESTAPVATPTSDLPDSSLFLPCHYFQYAGGTSTGGLISIMISRFRMTVDECLQEYKTLGSDVFGKPRPFTMKSLLWDKFNEKRLHKAIEDVTLRHCENPRVTTKFPSPKDLCRTTVVAYNDKGTSEDPYLIRTFETFPPYTPAGLIRRTSSFKILDIRNAGPPQDMDIPLVGRATTAAPGYFRHLTTKIGDTTLRFKDGGFGCNNPSWETYKDVKALLANGSKDMGPFVSIGTGLSDVLLFPEKQGHLRHRWAEFSAVTKGLPTRTKGAHDAMLHAAYPDNQKKFQYSRFDGGSSLGSIPMDEWVPNDRTRKILFMGKHKNSGRQTLKKIEDAITLYLAEKEVQEELDECAKILVQRRRRQTRDQSKWDRFASASSYICPYKKCKERRHDTLEMYKGHVRRFHPDEANQKQLDAEAHHARRCWLYRDRENSNIQPSNNDSDGHEPNPASRSV